MDNQKNILQREFKSPLEKKSIHQFNACGKFAKNIVKKMGSNYIKEIISQQIGELPIISTLEKSDFAGYSPYHINNNK